ncbi:hypothetical protein [Bradyrhizobium tropiciagri]|uniref:hypothetical protein n=1 Tax=Bradyrhizobium tropiciagri TaxID=312253 RepID=UPI001FCD9DA3|nr:hypothetical protein [Bradyrhizobium tropiciagri]
MGVILHLQGIADASAKRCECMKLGAKRQPSQWQRIAQRANVICKQRKRPIEPRPDCT